MQGVACGHLFVWHRLLFRNSSHVGFSTYQVTGKINWMEGLRVRVEINRPLPMD